MQEQEQEQEGALGLDEVTKTPSSSDKGPTVERCVGVLQGLIGCPLSCLVVDNGTIGEGNEFCGRRDGRRLDEQAAGNTNLPLSLSFLQHLPVSLAMPSWDRLFL